MKLTYAGKNARNYDVWEIEELGEQIEDWQKFKLVRYVGLLESKLNRELSVAELKHIKWLSAQDDTAFETFYNLFEELTRK